MGKTSLLLAALAICFVAIALTATAGTQQCNTACQSRMTDCILGCDGRLDCESDCKIKAIACVGWCSSDAGAAAMRAYGVPADGGAALVTDARPTDARATDANRPRPEAGKIQAARDH